MADLVKNLRDYLVSAPPEHPVHPAICDDAANEIERLQRTEVEQRRLKEGYYNEAADGWAKARKLEAVAATLLRAWPVNEIDDLEKAVRALGSLKEAGETDG